MGKDIDRIDGSLRSVREGLEVDGYQLEVIAADETELRLRITASPNACAECLSPPEIMTMIVSGAIDGAYAPERIDITYPTGSHS